MASYWRREEGVLVVNYRPQQNNVEALGKTLKWLIPTKLFIWFQHYPRYSPFHTFCNLISQIEVNIDRIINSATFC